MKCADCLKEDTHDLDGHELCGDQWVCPPCHRERMAHGPCPCEQPTYDRNDAAWDYVDDHIYPDVSDQ